MAWRRLQAPRAEMFCHPPFKNSERTCPAAVRSLRHKRLYRPHHQHQTVRPIQNFSSSRFSSSKPRGRCFDALPAAVAKSLSSGIIQQCSPRRQPRHTTTDYHTLRRLSLSDPRHVPRHRHRRRRHVPRRCASIVDANSPCPSAISSPGLRKGPAGARSAFSWRIATERGRRSMALCRPKLWKSLPKAWPRPWTS